MKKIVLSVAALAALSSVALAGSAFDKQLKRNMAEFPDHYAPVISQSYTAGNALAIDGGALDTIKQPGLEGHARR
jgi:hypothetical protein